MNLIQMFLPINDAASSHFAEVRKELTERFGGMTAFAQAPADGFWKDDNEHVSRDKIAVVEVMTPNLDSGWWLGYRKELEKRFDQETIVIRAMLCELL